VSQPDVTFAGGPPDVRGKKLIVWQAVGDPAYARMVAIRVKRAPAIARALAEGSLLGIVHATPAPERAPFPRIPGVLFRALDPKALPYNNAALAARYLKIVTPKLYPHADGSLCLDCDLAIQATPEDLDAVFLFAHVYGFVCTRHPTPTWTSEPLEVDQKAEYMARFGMHRFVPLWVCGAIARHHNNPTSIRLTSAWAEEFDHWPTREQTTLAAAVWASGALPLGCPQTFLSLAARKTQFGLPALFVHRG